MGGKITRFLTLESYLSPFSCVQISSKFSQRVWLVLPDLFSQFRPQLSDKRSLFEKWSSGVCLKDDLFFKY